VTGRTLAAFVATALFSLPAFADEPKADDRAPPEKADGPPVSSASFDEEIPPSRPQLSAGLTLAGTLSDLRPPDLHRKLHGGFAMGVRFDALFLRNKEAAMAIGPYLDVLTQRFSTLEVGAGASWLLPAFPSLPFVVSLGGLARSSERGLEPAIAARLFFGSRGYNFHGSYAMANGLFVDARWGIGGSSQGDLVMGIRLDFELLALPILFLGGTLKRL